MWRLGSDDVANIKIKQKEVNTMQKIQLKNVIISFPSIFNRAMFNGEEGKFEATFLIPKDDLKTKALLDQAIAKAIASAKIKVPSDKICLKDGDDSEYEGFKNNWSLKASTGKRPTVINRDKTPLIESDEVIYAGCKVNAIIDLWVQNNRYGKRVNANLYGIQFVADGKPFGVGNVDVTDEFDDLDDEL